MVGGVVGVLNFVLLRRLARRVSMPETVKVLNGVAIADLVLLPAVGALIGVYAWG